MTPRKKLPHHIEWAFEEILTEVTHISRLQMELTDNLHRREGSNPLLVELICAKMGTAAARIATLLGSIERREGPPTNDSTPADLTRNWIDMVAELVEKETSYAVLAVILSHKKEELT